MIITVYSSKGGVGKTPIAANILFDNTDFYIATNELNSGFVHISNIDDDKKILISPEDEFQEEVFTQGVFVKENASMVIDLSGSLAESFKSIPTALNISDVVLVPINNQVNSILQGVTTIQSIQEYFPKLKIIVVATKLEKQGVNDIFGDDWTKSKSFKEIQAYVQENTNGDLIVLPLKYSKGYENIIREEISIKKLSSVPFGGQAYKTPAKQFDSLYTAIGLNHESK
ncbi:hypothetical protein BHECKSOX_299 [Bathymodiolus heckerae thiotrophic gill symbiont]|uniref:ParA family protein n=1 Tax=Bathymodiolus heckerae thiotrophic gill symbiont TaxID=1052212 RepID=UPI0010B089DC|nr:ParA family protein [Bathymodiolus heckerae thiotrophic gill symbiont]SHN93475.1 hypothetical protein BHECKSOX_299 [Bathymodiolus heckerae thiotrophic gill symbiont]